MGIVEDKEKVLKKYVTFRGLRNKGRGLKDIEYHIRKFILSSPKKLEDFDEETLVNYVSKITPKYKTSQLNTVKSSFLKNFIKWYFIDWSSKFRQLGTICKTEKPPKAYSPSQMISEEKFSTLIKYEDTNYWKAYFLTLFYSSSRPIEICNLKWKDIEFEVEGAYFTIFSNKNKEEFLKYVPEKVSFYLKKLKDNGSEYVFYNVRTKKPLTVKGAYWKLRKLSKEAWGEKLNLYLLRHSIGTINYNKDHVKDDDIAKQMGHSKSMKKVYVNNNRDKLKQIAKRIYIDTEDLPKAVRVKLEDRIEDGEKRMNNFEKKLLVIETLFKNHLEKFP